MWTSKQSRHTVGVRRYLRPKSDAEPKRCPEPCMCPSHSHSHTIISCCVTHTMSAYLVEAMCPALCHLEGRLQVYSRSGANHRHQQHRRRRPRTARSHHGRFSDNVESLALRWYLLRLRAARMSRPRRREGAKAVRLYSLPRSSND